MDSVTLTRPDDFHLHLRDRGMLQSVVGFSARVFGRAIVMPNLKPPIVTTAEAIAYRDRILEALPTGSNFQPLMTLYLTHLTSPAEIDRAVDSGIVYAVKMYPAGATTHAEAGVTDLQRLAPTFARMAERGLPLLVHGEVTDNDIDVFDREAVFVDRVLSPLLEAQPDLRVVLEHITTQQATTFVRAAPANVAATITPQHLLYNRNALFAGGLRTHRYCLPVLKREHHRAAVREAALSGSPKFFLGSDSAPHPRNAKEAACGCAGLFSAPAALALYAQVFDDAGALNRLEYFASRAGADFYGLAHNQDRITLQRSPWRVPEDYPLCERGETIVPMAAGEMLDWQIA